MNKKVMIAMSGGVDSAGAAILLRNAGYSVSGVTLQLHHGNDLPDGSGLSAEAAAARKTAAAIEIPHTVLDLCTLFREKVMGRFVSEYTAGRTPNPCIDCNREIKFGALLDWALEQGSDYLATGHYARVSFDEASGRWLLLRGRDPRKDQSYMLYQLKQEQLRHILLPVGEYEKPMIRALAAKSGLDNAQQPDSQDICFIPNGDYMAFLREWGIQPQPGDFVDMNGRVLGRHQGQESYTLGQRKGLGVSAGAPVYVVRKDVAAGTVVLGPNEALFTREMAAERVNFISIPELKGPMHVTAKTRYSQKEAEAILEPLADGCVRLVFDEPQRAVTPGQAVVFYDGECVVGGGTIR